MTDTTLETGPSPQPVPQPAPQPASPIDQKEAKLRRRAADRQLPFMVRGLRVVDYNLRGTKEARRAELSRLRGEVQAQVTKVLSL